MDPTDAERRAREDARRRIDEHRAAESETRVRRRLGGGIVAAGLILLLVACWAYLTAPGGATLRIPTRGAGDGTVGTGFLFVHPVLIVVVGLIGMVTRPRSNPGYERVTLVVAALLLGLLQIWFTVDALAG